MQQAGVKFYMSITFIWAGVKATDCLVFSAGVKMGVANPPPPHFAIHFHGAQRDNFTIWVNKV